MIGLRAGRAGVGQGRACGQHIGDDDASSVGRSIVGDSDGVGKRATGSDRVR